jgi:hypothetical protein
VASCARAIGRLLEPPFVSLGDLITFDPALGWRTVANADTPYLADYDDVFRMVTDGDGWPGRGSIDDSAVIVVGDSFASGYGIDAGKSFADLNHGLAVKAVAVPGYSMVHGVLVMEQLGPRLAGKLVVWFVFLENDLQDNLAPELRGRRAPFARYVAATGWEIAAGHVTSERWTCSHLDGKRLFPRFCVPGPLADRAYAACDYLIGRGRAACDTAGAQLVVVTIPYPMQLTADGLATLAVASGQPDAFDPGLPDRRLAECCRRQSVAMIPAAAYVSRADYKRREAIHWNRRGHRRIAHLLRSVYEAHRAGRQIDAATIRAGHPRSRRTPARATSRPAANTVPGR